MKKSFLQSLLMLLVISATGQTANYFPAYKEQITNASHFAWIDPVIDTSGALKGFVFSDSWARRLVIQTQTMNREILLPGSPAMTINHWINDDSLIVYCVFINSWLQSSVDWLGKAVIHGDTFTWSDTLPPITYDWASDTRTNYRNIRFLSDVESPEGGVLFETAIRYFWMDLGISTETASFALIFDSELQTVRWKDNLVNVLFGQISNTDSLTYCGFNNYEWYWEWLYTPEDTIQHIQSTTEVIKHTPNEDPIFESYMLNCGSVGLFVGDFRSDYPRDEVIYYGDPKVAGITDTGHGYVAACYSYASGQRQILWHTYEGRWDTLSFLYQDGNVIAGRRGDSAAVFMNTRTGQISDSVRFPHSIASFRYFETGTAPKQLDFVGKVSDTIIVYQFDEITEAKNPDKPSSIPRGFTLSQNYPNPFNPSTTIAFTIPYRSQVQLRIYNTLGQNVRVLVDEVLSAGDHTVIWNGKNDAGQAVASGMYFYEVVSKTFSQSKKMILLK